ncbi:MAG: hypothetical protein AAF899_03065 [Pseudomonadota bacterium]
MTMRMLGVLAGGLLAAGLSTGSALGEDESRLERAGENCKEMLRQTFSLKEDTEIEISGTSQRSRDRTFMTATIDVPGAGPQQIRCQLRDRGDGIRRLRVLDESDTSAANNNGWGSVDDLARRAAVAAAAQAEAEALAAEAEAAETATADGAGDDQTATDDDATADSGTGAAGAAGTGTGTAGDDAETADSGDAGGDAGGDDGTGAEETAEADAEEEEAPSGPVFKRVN